MIRAIPVDHDSRFVGQAVLLREWFLDSMTVVPIISLVGAVVLAWIMDWVDEYIMTQGGSAASLFGSTASAISVTSVIASSMLSFLAVVFSVALVALQLANQQFSPRVLHTFTQSTTVKVMLGLSTGTFAYALLILFGGIASDEPSSPLSAVTVAVILVFVTIIVFVLFVKKIVIMIHVGHLISIVAEETYESIVDEFPLEGAYRECRDFALGEPCQVIPYRSRKSWYPLPRGPEGAFLAVSTEHLVQLAEQDRCVIRVLPKTGDYIVEGDPIVEVYGDAELKPEKCLSTFFVGPERTVLQDPAYGMRSLVDMALQALSPAVNAPTTATQVIYRLSTLLQVIANRPVPTGYYSDTKDHVRVIRPMRAWDEYVDLAFTEIIEFGATSSQVCMAVQHAFGRLLANVPPNLQEPLLKQQRKLQAAADCSAEG